MESRSGCGAESGSANDGRTTLEPQQRLADAVDVDRGFWATPFGWLRLQGWVLGLFLISLAGLHPTIGEEPRPNILLIVADDLGFSDLGCYGGEIATPHLDSLAQSGLRFTQFYNTARCWPSRAAILTGYYAQQVRRDTVPGIPSGTGGVRPVWAPLLPELLRPLGYRSYHSGKWHLDGKPLQNGFDHSYSLNDHDRYFAPKFHTEDDVPLPPVSTNTGYYATTAIAEHAIRCLKRHATEHPGAPFFEFLAFTSPHFPVQAPVADIARYRGRYLEGWDSMREARWARMRSLGIGGSTLSPVEREVGPPYPFPEAIAQLGPFEVNRPFPWNELTEAQRRFQSDKMAVHAAMVDRMDREIGRVLQQVKDMGAWENTLVLFLSDNGASAEMMVRGDGHQVDAECGTGATFLSIGPGWSSLANTPFRRHKTWVHEGGISTPLILSWPKEIPGHGELRHAAGHVVDLVPTLVQAAGGILPATWAGKTVPERPGRSLAPLFAQDLPAIHETLWWQHEGNRALRRGDWKMVAAGETNDWELYDLHGDRSETRNLAAQRPEVVRQMATEWNRQRDQAVGLAHRDLPNPYHDWRHSGSMFLNTTSDGALLPSGTVLSDFPILVRFSRESFPFGEADGEGADVRFAAADGRPLAYQIEEWNAEVGRASVWVRIPTIRGNSRQEVRVYWGNRAARSESSGPAVFNASNGYLGVWHLDGGEADATGQVRGEDLGTSPISGVIGPARHFPGGRGIRLGEHLVHFPSGSAPHSSQAWFRAEVPNTTLVGWGNEQAQGKVVMQFRSPPHINLDCYFSDGNVRSAGGVPRGEWVHVVHTYEKGDPRVYLNGVLSGSGKSRANPLSIRSPARGWIGGWYDHFDYVGDLDEVRVSSVARSAEWIRLEYENQKPLQTLVGWMVPAGTNISVSPATVSVWEGRTATVTAEVGGAERVAWSWIEGPTERLVASNQRSFTFDAGRVSGTVRRLLRFRAITPHGNRIQDIPVEIREDLPEPVVVVEGPGRWNGRTPVELVARVVNQQELATKGVGACEISWQVTGPAVIRSSSPGRLRLERAQGAGVLTVEATVHNGGQPSKARLQLEVSEPRRDRWVERKPVGREMPEDNQLYARDDRNQGTLICHGAVEAPGEKVFLRVYADDRPYRMVEASLPKARSFHLAVSLKPGLVRYRSEFGVRSQGVERVLETATNLVCGDAYLIQGQSNAVATDWGPGEPAAPNEWVRTFGSMTGNPEDIAARWGIAVSRGRDTEAFQVGAWGLELARHLVEKHRIPIGILNGAVGGTRIDQHQRDPLHPENPATIYGRLLRRVRAAHLTHGIRGILWHQGENDQGSDGPTGGYGWESYREYFVQLAGAWKQDFPNLQHSYLFQIWPYACSMGVDGSDNRLREAQRQLPSLFSRWSIQSTVGIQPAGGCHFPAAGYAQFARVIEPLVERDHYGVRPTESITPPNLVRAGYVGAHRDQVRLEFDQPVTWSPRFSREFFFDGKPREIRTGQTAGNALVLTLAQESTASTIGYLDGRSWSPERVLRGKNGIAALTFWDVPLADAPSGSKPR